jgi:hypothetical protein
VPVLYGARLLLDPASAHAISPWLHSVLESSTAPGVEIRVSTVGNGVAPPAVVSMLFAGPRLWIGRTAAGLVLGDGGQSWFSVEGTPPVIRGGISHAGDGAPLELFLRALLIALRRIGVYGLHAAAVCTDASALVLIGDSGAGKSTTTTALVSAGCRYLGDDALLIRERSGDVELLAYSPWFRLTDQVVPSFATLRDHLSKHERDDKWRLDASSAFPDRHVADWHGPKTLLFLEHSSRSRSVLSPVTLAEATGLLISQSGALGLGCHPNPRQHLDLLARLASRAQIARLELGSEWLENPTSAARGLIEQANALSRREHIRGEAP